MAVNMYDQPAQAEFINTYVPVSFQDILQAGANKQQNYDVHKAAYEQMADEAQNLRAIPTSQDEEYIKGTVIPTMQELSDKYATQDYGDPEVIREINRTLREKVNRRLVGQIQESYTNWQENQKNVGKLKMAGQYQDYIDEPYKGYSTANAGTYTYQTPAALDYRKPAEEYFNQIKPSTLTGINPATGEYYVGVDMNKVTSVAKENVGSYLQSPAGQQKILEYRHRTGDMNTPAEKIAYDYLIDVGESYTYKNRDFAPEYYMRALEESNKSNTLDTNFYSEAITDKEGVKNLDEKSYIQNKDFDEFGNLKTKGDSKILNPIQAIKNLPEVVKFTASLLRGEGVEEASKTFTKEDLDKVYLNNIKVFNPLVEYKTAKAILKTGNTYFWNRNNPNVEEKVVNEFKDKLNEIAKQDPYIQITGRDKWKEEREVLNTIKTVYPNLVKKDPNTGKDIYTDKQKIDLYVNAQAKMQQAQINLGELDSKLAREETIRLVNNNLGRDLFIYDGSGVISNGNKDKVYKELGKTQEEVKEYVAKNEHVLGGFTQQGPKPGMIFVEVPDKNEKNRRLLFSANNEIQSLSQISNRIYQAQRSTVPQIVPGDWNDDGTFLAYQIEPDINPQTGEFESTIRIGKYAQEKDGSFKLDQNGQPVFVPAYDQNGNPKYTTLNNIQRKERELLKQYNLLY
jgi:hypothetical protein